jgi:hypothetical protein
MPYLWADNTDCAHINARALGRKVLLAPLLLDRVVATSMLRCGGYADVMLCNVRCVFIMGMLMVIPIGLLVRLWVAPPPLASVILDNDLVVGQATSTGVAPHKYCCMDCCMDEL